MKSVYTSCNIFGIVASLSLSEVKKPYCDCDFLFRSEHQTENEQLKPCRRSEFGVNHFNCVPTRLIKALIFEDFMTVIMKNSVLQDVTLSSSCKN